MIVKRKIVFIFNIPAVEGFINKYCLEQLIDLGYEVTILDVSYVLEQEYDKLTSLKRISDKRFIYIKLMSKREIDNYFKNNMTSIYFPMFDANYRNRYINFLLTKYKIEFAYVNNLLADMRFSEDFYKKITLERLKPTHLYRAFYNRVLLKLINYKSAKFIALAGDKYSGHHFKSGLCNDTTKIVYLYSFDYERLLKSPNFFHNKPYCVFIDTYTPFHPDIVVHQKIYVEPKKYYEDLNLCLKKIQDKYELDIIIAAHPKADYNDKTNLFDNCEIVYNRTPELIKNAQIVLGQYSTALSIAIAIKKPIILLKTTDIFENEYHLNALEIYKNYVGAPVLSCNDDINDIDPFQINFELYEDFKKNYFAYIEPNGFLIWELIMSNFGDTISN